MPKVIEMRDILEKGPQRTFDDKVLRRVTTRMLDSDDAGIALYFHIQTIMGHIEEQNDEVWVAHYGRA